MKSTSLVKINFSRNFITEVNNLPVSLIPNLESIEISNNKITRIPQLNFPHLMEIDMKDNPLEKIDELKTSNLSAL
jgi:Leucine-rich repeat (LRR) protein